MPPPTAKDAFLHKDDSFNILLFDNKISSLFKNPKSPTRDKLNEARSFLRKATIGSFFKGSNFILPLNYVLSLR